MWIARDKDNSLWLYDTIPTKEYSKWCAVKYLRLDSDLFPEIKWEDEEPTGVELVIKKHGTTRI